MFHELRDLDGDCIARAHDTDRERPTIILYCLSGVANVEGLRAIAALRDLCTELLAEYTTTPTGDDDATDSPDD